MEENDPLIGKEIGRCRLERRLGAGGMGAVYLSRHTGLGKPFAIKVLSSELLESAEYIERFLREARLAARLEHPNVVQVFDAGEEQGVYYIRMQYVEGRGLDAILREKKKLSTGEALSVAKRVALGLGAAHQLGIIHRDIKPANILVSKDGILKVADFGLAKDTGANASLSLTGQIMGTPDYMSPEQARGDPVDARTDLYSLGATLYHLLAGRRPFPGASPVSILAKQVNEEPEPLGQIDPAIPPGVCALVARLMRKRAEDRPGSAEELVRELEALRTTGAGVAPPVVSAPVGGPAPPARPRRTILAFSVVGLLLGGMAMGVWLSKGRGSRPPVALQPSPAPEVGPPAPPTRESPAEAPGPGGNVPADPRKGLLSRFRDAQERRFAEELLGRSDRFLRALQARDPAQARPLLDRLVFGEASQDTILGIFSGLLGENSQLAAWETEDVEVRHLPVLRVVGSTTVTLSLKTPRGEIKLVRQTFEWNHKLDGQWSLRQIPKPFGK